MQAIKRDPNETEKVKLTTKIDKKLNTKLPVLKQATPKTLIYMHEIARSEKEIKVHNRRRSLMNASSNGELNNSISSGVRKGSRQLLSEMSKPYTTETNK